MIDISSRTDFLSFHHQRVCNGKTIGSHLKTEDSWGAGEAGSYPHLNFFNLDASKCHFQGFSSQYLGLKDNQTFDYLPCFKKQARKIFLLIQLFLSAEDSALDCSQFPIFV